MEKNPISLLQECMSKKRCSVPMYTVVKEQNGSHLNHFVIKVDCDEHSTKGEGSSKKEAKLNAAIEMLKLLKIYCKNDNSHTYNEHQKLISTNINDQTNFVGKLGELAQLHNLLTPEYSNPIATGPQHNLNFTTICKYQDFEEEGKGKTKKEAKNNAAKRMYERLLKEKITVTIVKNNGKLENYLKDSTSGISQLKVSEKNQSFIKESSEKALQKYSVLTKTGLVKSVVDQKKSFHEYYSVLKCCLTVVELNTVVNKLVNVIDTCKQFSSNTKMELEQVLNILNLNLKEVQYDSKTNYTIYGLQLNTHPVISEIGFGVTKKEAEISAIAEIAKTLIIMLI